MKSIPLDQIAENWLGIISVSMEDLLKMLGPPHFETDDPDLFPGPVSIWGVELDDGTRVAVEFYRTKGWAQIHASTSDLVKVVEGLGFRREQIE